MPRATPGLLPGAAPGLLRELLVVGPKSNPGVLCRELSQVCYAESYSRSLFSILKQFMNVVTLL